MADLVQARYLASRFALCTVLLGLLIAVPDVHAQDLAQTQLAPAQEATVSRQPAYSSSEGSSGPADAASSTNPAPDALPDAPDPQNTTPPATGQQTKRILGIIPNFRAVSADEHLPPQTVHDKFSTAFEDSFDYSSIFIPTVLALYNYERDATPEFGAGGTAFGRYLWHSAADQTVENMMVEFVVPAATHEDTRYYTLGHGGALKRSGYALTRIVVTRSDSGKEVFNFSEVLGAGAAAGISDAYYPGPERTAGNTLSNWGVNLGVDAATFLFKEFWPDINQALFHTRSASPDTPSR